MDDESNKADSPSAIESDSEDDIVVACKKSKKKVIMEDSDDDDDAGIPDDEMKDKQDNVDDKFIKYKCASDVLNEVMEDIENSDNEDSETEMNVGGTDDIKNSEITQANNNTEATTKTKTKLMFDSDIFDAEESSDDNDRDNNNVDNASSDEDREEGADEGFDESSIDPKLLMKLKKLKGAGKTATSEGKRRKAKDVAMSIHSESQRLVRESHANLPYHQPVPKSLDDFLARASKKQEQYKCLRSVRDNKNAKVIEETLSDKKDIMPSETSPKTSKMNILKEKAVSQSKLDNTVDSSLQNSTSLFETLCNLKNDEENDELPDIPPSDTQSFSVSQISPANTDPVLLTCDTGNLEQSESSAVDKNTNTEDHEFTSKCLMDDNVLQFKDEKCLNDQNLVFDCETLTDIKCKDVETTETPKQKILSRLNLINIESMPKLSGKPDTFICFEEESTPKNPELHKFMNRFLEQSKKKQIKTCKDIDISIIQKESVGNKEELKLNSFTYHIDDEEQTTPVDDVPGRKLMSLKEKLQAAMKLKREESRQKRQEMYAMENEEGFEGGSDDEDAILDDETELTDGSDTDVDDDEFDKQFGDDEIDEEERVENPFVDDEADEEDDDNDGDIDEEGTIKLQLDTSDDEEESIKMKPKSQRQAVISDDEESRDTVNDDMNVDKEVHDQDEDEMSPLTKHLTSNTPKPSRVGSVTLPIENTQDLYDDTQNDALTDTQPSPSLNFLLEDSQSQMLDSDGFLKVRSSTKQPSRRSLGVEDNMPVSTQDNMDELLGLCSGRFAETKNNGKSCKSLFGDDISTQGSNMDELLGLCSGVFAGSAVEKSQGVKRKLGDEEDDESNTSFKMLSADEDSSETDELSNMNNGKNTDSDEDVPRIILKSKRKKGLKDKHGKIRQEFVDGEAELSGSEYESDEDFDIDEDEDILMEEEGDKDTSITETELRDQVGRAHLKQVIDEDKRELMRFQEMYLPDGDLHSEGAGRIRRFRWSNIDDESQQDMFDQDSEGEEGEEDVTEEVKWRIERFKREQFLEEQKENEEKKECENEDSQILKFGKCFLQKKDSTSIKTPMQRSASLPISINKPDPTFVKPSLKGLKRGSFLNRSKEDLAKIADRTKIKMNPNATTHSRNFVFQVLSPDKGKIEPQIPKSKATPTSFVKQPPAKRQKLVPTKAKYKSSIFKLLEK